MTDKQLVDFLKKKTIDELMTMLINYGRACENCENLSVDLKKFDTVERLINLVKKEIRSRMAFEF